MNVGWLAVVVNVIGMESRRQPYPRQSRPRRDDQLDRRLDQWLETGRQLVDGVAGTDLVAAVEWLGVPVARLGPASTLSVAGWETRLIGCLMKRMTGVSPGSQSRRLEPFATVPPHVSMPSLGTAVPSALAANGVCRRFPGVSPLSSLLRMSLRL